MFVLIRFANCLFQIYSNRPMSASAATASIQQMPSAKVSPSSRYISKSLDSAVSPESSPPPSPPIRQISSSIPPDVRPRHSSRSSSITSTSPIKQVVTSAPLLTNNSSSNNKINAEPPERRKRSIDLVDDASNATVSPVVEYAEVRKHSIDLSSSFASPIAQPISSSPSSGLSISSGPSSPNHTEDEKQENESNEKTDLFDEIITECKFSLLIVSKDLSIGQVLILTYSQSVLLGVCNQSAFKLMKCRIR